MNLFGFKGRRRGASSSAKETSAAVRSRAGDLEPRTRRRKRRDSHTSLPRDMHRRSYYAPQQKNFYPPNVHLPAMMNGGASYNIPQGYGTYFAPKMQTAVYRDFEDNLMDELTYAQQLYRKQFLFYRPRKAAPSHQIVAKPATREGFGNGCRPSLDWNWGFRPGASSLFKRREVMLNVHKSNAIREIALFLFKNYNLLESENVYPSIGHFTVTLTLRLAIYCHVKKEKCQ